MLQKLEKWHVVAILLLVVFTFLVVLWPSEVPPRPGILSEDPEQPMRGLPQEYVAARAGFSIEFGDVRTDLRLMSTFVLPGEVLRLSTTGSAGRPVAFSANEGIVEETGPQSWAWTAPDTTGLFELNFVQERTRDRITLKAFVKVPYDPDQESLNGYVIGQYEREPYRENPFYALPNGFIEVRPHLLEERVTPHFILGQFVCKQVSEYPEYLLLQEQLLLKLEMLLAVVNGAGIEAPTFHVMSGFRTPYYNRLIGNRTRYSVHLYGGAADIFVDADGDVYMDDLDGDGDAGIEEAHMLAALVEEQADEPWYKPFVGGLGIYAPAPHRGPFIHVDVRGEPARW